MFRHIKREKAAILVDLRFSEMSLLKHAITKVKPHVKGPFITVVVPLFLKSTIGVALTSVSPERSDIE